MHGETGPEGKGIPGSKVRSRRGKFLLRGYRTSRWRLCVCVPGGQRFIRTTRTIRSPWHRLLRPQGQPAPPPRCSSVTLLSPLPFGLDLQGSAGQPGPGGPPGPPGEGIQGPKVGGAEHLHQQTPPAAPGGGLQTQNLTFQPLLEVDADPVLPSGPLRGSPGLWVRRGLGGPQETVWLERRF